MSTTSPARSGRARHGGRGSAGSAGRGVRALALVLVAVVSAGLLTGAGYLWYNARGIDDAGTRLPVAVGAAGGSDVQGTAQNILLVGNDDRSNMTDAEVSALHLGRDGGSMATDTMMIVHVPADGSKATLISLPRDSYVAIPGHGMDKLNSAYSYGYNGAGDAAGVQTRETAGINLLLQTVKDLTGLTMNHYIQVSLLGFYRLSEAIGPIPIDLCEDVDDTVAYNRSTGQDGGSGFKMSKGEHDIYGVTALEFVRQRHNLNGGDLDRVKRQQYFLTAAFRQVAQANVVTKLAAIKGALARSIVADSGLKLFDLAKQMSDLSADNIIGRTIPTTSDTIDGTSVQSVDPAQVRSYVEKLVNPPAPTTTPGSTSASSSATGSPGAPSASTPADAKCIN